MSRLLPFRSPVALRDDRTPRLIEIEDDAADQVFEALASKTARTVFTSLHDEPATASDLTAQVDTSLQNVRYHLDKLVDAELVEVVDTWYSDRGREMKVYAPTNTSLVMLSGREAPAATLREVLERLVGGIGVLGIASLLFDRLVEARFAPTGREFKSGSALTTSSERSPTRTPAATAAEAEGDGGGGAGGDGAGGAVDAWTAGDAVTATGADQTLTGTPAATPTPGGTASVPTTVAPASGVDAGGLTVELLGVAVPPGAIFFVGGLFVLLVVVAWYSFGRRAAYAR